MGTLHPRWIPALALLLAVLLPGRAAHAVSVSAPSGGAVVGQANIVVSGRADGSAVQASLNGRTLPAAAVRDGFFSLPLTLSNGVNRLNLRSGPESADLVIEYRSDGASYRFHPGYAEGECGDCHEKGIGRISARTHSGLCHSCHDSKDTASFLHGPVGAGQCAFCHDPHGSSQKAFLTRGGASLCSACHDQPGSRKHMDQSRSKECTACHNPHGSEKRFFLY